MSLADEIQKLADLKEQGALSEDEFQRAKSRAMSVDAANKRDADVPAKNDGMGWFGKIMLTLALLVVGFFAIGIFASDSETQQAVKYTGVLRIDAGTEYVALNELSSIGGACEGWNAVAIQKPGISSGAMKNIVCWKLVNGRMAITDRLGAQQTSGPVSAWSD